MLLVRIGCGLPLFLFFGKKELDMDIKWMLYAYWVPLSIFYFVNHP